MNFLKVLSFAAGLLVLLGTPFVLPEQAQALSFAAPAYVLIVVLGILIFAGNYFFFAISGRRIRRSFALRCVACALLVYQFIAGGWLVSRYQDPEVLGSIGPLLCLSIFLFGAFCLPSNRERRYRRRDPAA